MFFPISNSLRCGRVTGNHFRQGSLCSTIFKGNVIASKQITFQIGKSDGTKGSQFENQHLATAVHRAFELRNRIRISLIECDLVGNC